MTKTELDKLVRQSNSKSCNVRHRVAQNPNCPVEAIVRLSGDKDECVREEAVNELLSRKKKASPEEMELIAAYELLLETEVI
jgi:hypothetical protein